MTNKQVIIIPNENMYSFEPYIKGSNNTTHKEKLIEFIYETGIEICNEDIFRISSQELAYYLTEQGFCVMLQKTSDETKENNLTVYLPQEISENQRIYFKLAASLLDKSNLTVFSMDQEEPMINYQRKASTNVDELIKYVNQIPLTPKKDNLITLTRKK